MYQLHVETDFSAAHNLRGYEGKCENLHGHNYKVEVKISGKELNEIGMLADFKEVKGLCEDVVDRLDHGYLNDSSPFDTVNPTTENIAAYICEKLQDSLKQGLQVDSVKCWESERCAAIYIPESG